MGCLNSQNNTYVREGMGEEETPFKDMEAGIILGSGKFKTKVMEFLGTIEAHEELPQIKRRSLEKLVHRTSAHCDYVKSAAVTY
jgi:hypothetical protein